MNRTPASIQRTTATVANGSFSLSATGLAGWWMPLAATAIEATGLRTNLPIEGIATRARNTTGAAYKLGAAQALVDRARWDDPVDDAMLPAISDPIPAAVFGLLAGTPSVEVVFLHYPDSYQPTWGVLQNMAVDTAPYGGAPGLLTLANNGTAMTKFAYSAQAVSGVWKARLEHGFAGEWWGLASANTDVAQDAQLRIPHAFTVSLNLTTITVQELGVTRATRTVSTGANAWVAMEIEDTGTAIRYRVQLDSGGPMTTLLTSTRPYTPGAAWYIFRAGRITAQPLLPIQVSKT
jgi:hypothetical protein